MDGIINVYKEKGYTSFDVVACLRKILKIKKIGHTGTLDPDAEGVLPVCIGKATKLCEKLTDHDKTYIAGLRLGITTDTQDMTGKVLTQNQVNVTKEELESIIKSFVGDYNQIPPMYSALKVNGKKLYELARAGIEVERKSRLVKIIDINIIDIDIPFAKIEVSCTKGTYIRTLISDIGEKCNCGAVMETLKRTKVDRFDLEKSHKLSEIEEYVKNDRLNEILLPIADVFSDLKQFKMTKNSDRFLINGNRLKAENFAKYENVQSDGEEIAVYNSDGQFRAVYKYCKKSDDFKVCKMF
ncbi:tRNA pseudouridine synthase B [Acetitomaculum ruminis DSM 5522]|uniref:tRNA pseudouridine synthase B n=1 Tax=Acetitomaculum ruminis DSM 5522 TaxID=1120918 RepID=A0A1I0XR93_9FIRM|nr:tRNA pseudouridine(55) synthase TruB [Acetitomaculum ruminis]SFB03669.1 tRNA pseudouridine synthase B [Acetitomaculum ruminis DSM 5522]